MISGPAFARVFAPVCAPNFAPVFTPIFTRIFALFFASVFASIFAPVAAVLLSLTATAAPAAPAADVIAVPGKLSDSAFYRLVGCGAPPAGDCGRPMLRWRTESPIRVALRRIDRAYLGRPKQRAEAALSQALRQLNGADAGFRLARVGPADRAEITVYFLGLNPGDPIAGTGIDWVDGTPMQDMTTLIAVNPERTRILGAAIVVSAGLETRAFEGAMLKALTRCMGLTTEVDAPAYEGVSALAYDSYTATRLGPQDLAALRKHYATKVR